jgi:hypothetical protein
MANAMMTIYPYFDCGDWVFDDAAVGLKREPFVFGVPEMSNEFVRDVPGAKHGYELIFSMNPFPEYQAKLIWLREEYGGNWYSWEQLGQKGWLCPALFKYFDEAPQIIYCRVKE